MSQILNEARVAAQEVNFIQPIKPILKDDWQRNYTITKVGNLEIPIVGILTAAESAVIQHYRTSYSLIHQGLELATSMFLLGLSQKLGFEDDDYRKVLKWAQTPEDINKSIEEGLFTSEEVIEFKTIFVNLQNEFNVSEAKSRFEFLIISFFICFRVDPDWTYDKTTQLSPEEQKKIVELIYQEEAIPKLEKEEIVDLKKK